MADDVDRAQAINEQLQNDAMLEHYRRGIRNTMYAAEELCEDCGEPIPEARRQAVQGCFRCVSCQTAFEVHIHGRAL